MNRVILVVGVVLALLVASIGATTIHVPADYLTIQEGIDAAINGDTVLVADGHYYERINFCGKSVLVTSVFLIDQDSLHITNTIIDGDTTVVPVMADTGSVVCFVNEEDSTSIIQGFTIQNGIGTPVYFEFEELSIVEDSGGIVSFMNEQYATHEIQELIRQKYSDIQTLNELEKMLRETDIFDDTCGGAVLCYDSSPVIQNCIIKDNMAGAGGGVFGYGSSQSMDILGCSITHNVAENGAGISLMKPLVLNPCFASITDCRVDSNDADDGAAVYFKYSRADIFNCSISDNIGSGIEGHTSYLYCDSCIIRGNGSYGINFYVPGEDYIYGGSLEISKTTIAANGVAVYSSHANLIIDSCEVLYNGQGIDVFLSGGGNFEIYNSNIIGNEGYGIKTSSGMPHDYQIENCYIAENGSGGIFSTGEATVHITNDILENNSGGGIRLGRYEMETGNGIISSCIIRGNSADSGGGISFLGFGGRLINCLIENNTATYGGGIYCDSYDIYTPYLSECTISGNSAQYGSGICFGSRNVNHMTELENSIIAFGSQGEAITNDGSLVILDLSCCDIYGNEGGDWVGCIEDQAEINGNFSANPLFCDTANSDYHIASNSPCAPENNECEILIGAYGIGCEAFPIPTLSEWGMIILALLVLVIGTVAIIRRRMAVTIEGRQ